MILLLLTIAMALVLFYAVIFVLDIPGAWKFALVVAEMLAVNQLLIRRYKMPSEIGLVLVKSKRGIELIERLARSEKAFNFMADVGASMSYGVLSVALMRKNVSAKSLVCGLALLLLLARFVAPVALTFLMYVVGIGSADKSGGTLTELSGGLDAGLALMAVMLLAGGLFLMIMFGIVFYGIVIFKAIVTSIFFQSDAITKVSPGGDILLPGVNLPFLEGVVVLAIVMVVHEGAHAVLARLAKIPLLSSGIVLFGIIPIGAFVEPDEGKLVKAEKSRQTRVMVAGPTANMIAAAAFFILFMGFFLVTADSREGSLYIQYSSNTTRNPLPNGLLIYEINGTPVEQIDFASFSLPPNESVALLTNRGTIERDTNENGKLGIEFYVLGKDSLFSRYSDPVMQFVYIVLGLSVALNFVVGTVNILPIPLFDGYRVVDVNVKNKLLVKVLSYSALFFFVLNFVPKLFH